MSQLLQATLEKLVERISSGAEIPSVEITYNGKYKGTFIVPPINRGMTILHEIKTHAEYLGVRGNSVLSPEVRNMEDTGGKEEYPNLIKARAVRKAKREGVKA